MRNIIDLIESLKATNTTYFQTFINIVIAFLIVISIIFVFNNHPVLFSYLVTESQFVELFTSLSYFVSSLIFIYMLITTKDIGLRIIYLILFLISFFIFGEEISWGQMLVWFSTPEIFSNLNYQNETNLHNSKILGFIFGPQDFLIFVIISLWCIYSVLFRIFSRFISSVYKKYLEIVSIPIKLIPFFIVVPFLLITWPVIKSDEFVEMILGLSILLWSIFLLYSQVKLKSIIRFPIVIYNTAILFFISFFTIIIVLSINTDNALTYRLNWMTSEQYGYPRLGMYKEAAKICNYLNHNEKFAHSNTHLTCNKITKSLNK